MIHVNVLPTKEELEKLVWNEPISSLAKRSGVTYEYVVRLCKMVGVERPPKGYWAKVKHGLIKAGEKPK